jgi:molybdenum cofactor cytidylyltransferase
LSVESGSLSAVVLAAGQSTRTINQNKLLSLVNGTAIVVRVVDAIFRAGISEIIVVTGHQPEMIRSALSNCDVRFVHNTDYRNGMSTSLGVGVSSLGRDIDAALIFLGDMPGIRPQSIRALVQAFDPEQPRICAPIHDGKRGHPVLWPAAFFAQMTNISGDRGARHLLDLNKDVLTQVRVSDEYILEDVDTLDDLHRIQKKYQATEKN